MQTCQHTTTSLSLLVHTFRMIPHSLSRSLSLSLKPTGRKALVVGFGFILPMVNKIKLNGAKKELQNKSGAQNSRSPVPSGQHVPRVALWLFRYMQYILWQDYSNLFNSRERRGAVDTAEVSYNCFSSVSAFTSPCFWWSVHSFIECNFTTACKD